MIYEIAIIVCIFLMGAIGIWFAYRFLKKKKKQAMFEKNIPTEMLEIFDEAEQKMKGGLKKDGTTIGPYKILWEIYKRDRENGIEHSADSTIRTEQAVDDRELPKQPIRRESIPNRITTDVSKDDNVNRQPKQNNLRRIISGIRGRATKKRRGT